MTEINDFLKEEMKESNAILKFYCNYWSQMIFKLLGVRHTIGIIIQILTDLEYWIYLV